MKANREKLILGGLTSLLFATVLFLIVGPSLWSQPSKEPLPLVPKPAVPGEVDPKYAAMFQEIMTFISNNYVDEPDQLKLFEGAMKGMFESLNDPYTLYLTEEDSRTLKDTTTGEYGGLGLYIEKIPPSQLGPDSRPKDFYVEITAPIEDTPAWKAGLLAGDYITTIEGKTTKGMTLDEVLAVLRGRPNTSVKIGIIRGENINFEVTLTRAKITIPSVKSTMIDKNAYLRIMQFSRFTPQDVEKALGDFQKAGYKNLIIDLRGNPGGLLEEVSRIAGFFFKDGLLVSTRSRIPGENKEFKADGNQIVPDSIPIIVLTDHYSASASEILAGALKDRGRAFLLGETTYGKGSVQNVINYGRTGFKITIARYYTPSGVNIDKVGIKPDQELKVPEMKEKDLDSYKKLTQDRLVENFAKEAAFAPTEAQIQGFLKDMTAKGITLEPRVVRKLIRNEVSKGKNTSPPIYDLEYDLVLSEALKLLDKGTVKAPAK